MQDTESIVEEKKEVKPRNVRRAEKDKQEALDKLLHLFFTKRSAIKDPEGTEAACLLDEFDRKWKTICANYNRTRTPIKLRYEAFTEGVEFYLNMEKKAKAETAEANKLMGFKHWMRRAHVWKTRPLTAIYYWIKSLGNKEKVAKNWEEYYKSLA